MGSTTRTLSLAAALVLGVAASVGSAAAQTAYPTKPIKLIIPYAPGGGSDAAAAIFTDKLAQKLGQPIVKENRPGSNSVIGTAVLATSPPDGHTLMVVTGAIANNPSLYATLPYKTPDSFTAVSILTSYPFVLGVRADLPVKDIKELVAYAKANPGKLTAATSGRGAAAQLSLGLFNKTAGVEIREIPFKGAGDSLNNVAGGFVDMVFSGYETVAPFAENKKIRMIGHTGKGVLGKEKIPAIGDTVPGFEYQNWLGLFAPAGTPKAVTDKINDALTQIFAEQETKDRLAGQNIDGIASRSAEATEYFKKEIAASKSIIEGIGLKPE